MSGTDKNDGDKSEGGKKDDLGGGWLSEPSDDELGAFLRHSIPPAGGDYWQSIERRLSADTPVASNDELAGFLQDSIPTPGAGYWESVNSRLAKAERDVGHTSVSDTDDAVVRPMAMNTPTTEKTQAPPRAKSPKILLSAAALVLLAGLGLFALNRSGSTDDGIDLATQPEATATEGTAAAPPLATQPPVTPPVVSVTAAPLATMQTRLAGNESDTETLFCFAAADTLVVPIESSRPGMAVVQLSVQPNGSYSFLALQNENFLMFAAGAGSGDGMFETTPVGILGLSTQLPPYLVTLTNSSISFGDESTLPLVSCPDVASQIQIMRAEIAAAQDDINETIAEEGPLTVEPPLASISEDQVLSSGGLGPIRIGMLVSELEADLGVDLAVDTIGGGNVPGDCAWISSNLDQDVFIIVEVTDDDDAIVRRVSVRSSRWATPSGIRIGMTEQQVIDAFPDQLAIEPHTYVEDGQYLTFIPNDPNDPNTVEFVTEFAVLAEIRAGADGWVSLVEGCA